jgi:hypothetical protein
VTRILPLLVGAAALAAGLVRHRRANRENDYRVASPSRPDAFREHTRDDLYAQAKALGIPGRSKMRKADLERALAERMGPVAA